MDSKEIIEKVDALLTASGLKTNRDYIWSLQGPTLVYLGNDDPFKSLTIGQVKQIKEAGAKFLIDP